MSMAALMAMQSAENRRRRDDRGRYMDSGRGGGQYPSETRSAMETMTRPMWPMDNMGGEMRRRSAYEGGGEMRRRSADENGSRMGGEGWFVWDNASQPDHLAPSRYGQPGMNYGEGDNVVDMRTYDRRRNNMTPESHMRDEEKSRHMMRGGKIGFGEQDHEKHMTREKAEKWIRSMKTPDGKPLQPVPMSEIQRIAANYGVSGEKDMLEMWVVVNMMKSDYQDIGKKYAGDSVDFYAGLAKDWLEDKDAVEDKLHMYKKYIVEDDD